MTIQAQRNPGRENAERELIVDAVPENIEPVTEFVNRQLSLLECPEERYRQMDIAIDELFGNIAKYAYPSGAGPVTIRVEKEEDPAAFVVTLTDRGVPFDPLSSEDPDITLPAAGRKEGGLGIFLAKKLLDGLSYQYSDGSNILHMKLFP